MNCNAELHAKFTAIQIITKGSLYIRMGQLQWNLFQLFERHRILAYMLKQELVQLSLNSVTSEYIYDFFMPVYFLTFR